MNPIKQYFDTNFRKELYGVVLGVRPWTNEIERRTLATLRELKTKLGDKFFPTLVILFKRTFSGGIQIESSLQIVHEDWKERLKDGLLLMGAVAIFVAYRVYRLYKQYQKVKDEIELQETFMDVLRKAISQVLKSALWGFVVGIILCVARRLKWSTLV